ncbi:MAG: ATP-binding protein [Deltaproteobacteria bacterium]|nr:ATP-binding protein [Deltaproteobacteria bacterium]MBI3295910.1 ATP-binding protein [Deltaproteobacteria bacterium]
MGKTTSLTSIVEAWPPSQFVMSSADDRQVQGVLWIEEQWGKAREILTRSSQDTLLVLDEIQKIQNWSECVKKLWDEDVRHKRKLKVVLSGSSALSLQSGLSESLAGRFEVIPATHLEWSEFKDLTGKSIEEYIFFGGYPGALQFMNDETRWRSYISQSIVESILSRDILLLTRVDKPALLRRLFQLGCEFSGQVLSYQKILGQLHETGNTTTLAHYLDLLSQTFVLSGLQKLEKGFRKRGSSPKLQVHNTALMGALGGYRFEEARNNSSVWGRYLESAVGAHLMNRSRCENFEVYYWRDRNEEVDFIVKSGKSLLAIEVKHAARKSNSGLKRFKDRFKSAKTLVLTSTDLPEFLVRGPLL